MGYKLKEARRQAGLSQQELADKAKISRKTISDLENGRNNTPNTSTLVKIANVLGKTVDQIFFEMSV